MRDRTTSRGARIVEVIDETVLPRRYIVLGVAGLTFAAMWWDLNNLSGGDWTLFLQAARSMRHVPNIGVYIGPFALFFALPFSYLSDSTGWLIASVISMALGLVTIRLLEQTAEIAGVGSTRDRQRAVLFGGLFLLDVWALPAARWGHADDVIALTCVALAGRAIVTRRWLLASLAIAFAIATKPWAGLALPLAAACDGRRLRGVVVALVGAALPALPFVFLHHGHLGASSLELPVDPDSLVHYLGEPVYATPSWPRDVQLALGLPLGAYAVWKERWYLVPAIAFAVRLAFDPSTAPYYVTGAIFGLLLWDVMQPLRIWGLRTALGCIALSLLPTELDGFHIYGPTGIAIAIALRLLAIAAPVAALRRPGLLPATPGPGNPP
ncbi:MAG: hypothetical protein ACTHK4_01180 [Mycobacteriales bacterium]